jgi:hypothetical protein
MNALRISAPALLAAAFGCSALPSSSASHAKSDAAWRELRSAHFVLRTDADSEEAREALADFETAYEALRAILFSGDTGAPQHVVLFAGGADLRRFIPPGAVARLFLWGSA